MLLQVFPLFLEANGPREGHAESAWRPSFKWLAITQRMKPLLQVKLQKALLGQGLPRAWDHICESRTRLYRLREAATTRAGGET